MSNATVTECYHYSCKNDAVIQCTWGAGVDRGQIIPFCQVHWDDNYSNKSHYMLDPHPIVPLATEADFWKELNS